jgi:hypothetical protein
VREEYQTTGIDEYLQGRGVDAESGLARMGLRVPTLATPSFSSDAAGGPGQYLRYLFQFFAIAVWEEETIEINTLSQYLSIGAVAAAQRTTEFIVGQGSDGNPAYQLPGGSVSWHLRVAGWNQVTPVAGPFDSPYFKKRNSRGPALLYEDAAFDPANLDLNGIPDFYSTMTGYVPPNQGRPWGIPLTAELGTFYDVRFPHLQPRTESMKLFVPGPGVLYGFATVRQPSAAVAVGGSSVGLSSEEQFVNRFPGGDSPATRYWAIGMNVGITRYGSVQCSHRMAA